MTERIAIVGSRQGADLEQVERFVRALYLRQPSSLLVSGGAAGVDKHAEQTWLGLGGRVQSFRPKQLHQDSGGAGLPNPKGRVPAVPVYGVEVWNLGGDEPSVGVLGEPHPTWADYRSAAFYRDSLIAEKSDRIVAFYRRGRSHGTTVTMDFGHAYGRDLHEYEAAA